jgi:hypothetical protein
MFFVPISSISSGTVLALDDLHDANTPEFRAMLAVMLRELPDGIRCICLSRTLPQDELSELALRGQLVVVDQTALAFLDPEARTLVELRSKRAGKVDVAAARGWAVGLVLLAERGAVVPSGPDDLASGGMRCSTHWAGTSSTPCRAPTRARCWSSTSCGDQVGPGERDDRLRRGAKLLERLYAGQMLISRVESIAAPSICTTC